MEWVGFILGILSIFFGFCGFFLYLKVKKFLGLITEDQMEEAEPIIEKQMKKVKIDFLLCFILGIVALILIFI